MPMRLVVAVLVVVAVAASAPAATWISTGPSPAHVSALGLDPAQPATLYAGTTGGAVFRSTDDGATWQRLPPTGDFPILDIAVLGQLVLASSDAGANEGAGGVFRSVDGGGSWTFAGATAGITNGIVRPVAIDPANPSVMLAGTNGGLFRSVDGGSSWAPVAVPSGVQISDLVFDPAIPGTVYVATSNSGASRSVDHGAVFGAFNAGAALTSSLSALALDGTTLYAAGFYGAARTPTAAANWVDASDGLGGDDLFAIAVSAGRVLGSRGNNILSASTGFVSWSPAPSPGFSVSRLLADSSAPARFYATGNGLARSVNGGQDWQRLGADIPGLGTSVVAGTAAGSVLVGSDDGMLRSDDLGATFAPSSAGLTSTSIDGIVVDPVDPANVYAVAVPGLVASRDGGHTWDPLSFGFSTFFGEALAVTPSDPMILYGATFTGAIGAVRRSADNGMNWAPIPGGITFNFPHALAVDPTNADIAYLAADERLYATTNGGGVWSPADSGLPLASSGVRAIAIDPFDPATVLVSLAASVWRSPDRGASWVPAGAVPPATTVSDLLLDPIREGTVYLATDAGVLRSIDGGGSWQPFSDGLPNLHVASVALDRDHGALYAATDGGLAVSRFVAALGVAPTLSHSVVQPGGGSELAATVTNDGPDEATRVVVTAEGTPAIAFATATATVAGATCGTTPTARCELPRLDPGETAYVTFDAQTGPAGVTTITLVASAAQDVGANASASIRLRAVDGPYVRDEVLRVLKGKALVPIVCAAVAKKVCKGSLRLSSTSGATLGKARLSVRRGRTKTLKVRLRGMQLEPGGGADADATLRNAGVDATERVVLRRD